MKEWKGTYMVWSRNLSERYQLEYLGIHRRIILK